MPAERKIEIFDENGDRVGYEPLLSEEETREYFQTRKIRNPDNPNVYLYPPEILNPIVLNAHKQGVEFRSEMAECSKEENKNIPEKTEEKIFDEPEEAKTEEHIDSEVREAQEDIAEPLLSSTDNEIGYDREMELSKLTDFPLNKFPAYEGKRLEDMVESIKNFGVLTPLIVWKKEDSYIILSGHNRKRAAELAGLKTVPVYIKENLTDDEANLIMGETNFRQQSFTDMKHSQKAFCLKQHYAVMKNRGIKNDIIDAIESQNIMQKNNADFADNGAENCTCVTMKHQVKKRDIIGKEYNLSSAMVTKYIRIADLCIELLEQLDNGYIAFSAAYQLTFINNETAQKEIAAAVKNGAAIEAVKAYKLREYFEKHGRLTEDNIKDILAKRPKQSETVTLKPGKLKKYFTNGESKQQIERTIIEILEMYYPDYLKRKEQEHRDGQRV